MSRKSRQEQLRKRLNSLLSELLIEQGSDIPAITQDTNHSGWTWKCDQDGIYTYCSPEVLSVLGYAPEEIIGNAFWDFGLSPQSRERVLKAVDQQSKPFEVMVQIINVDGEELDISLNVIPDLTEDGGKAGWRGFMQVQKDMEDILGVDGSYQLGAVSQDEAVTAASSGNGPIDEEIDELSSRIEEMIDTGELVFPGVSEQYPEDGHHLEETITAEDLEGELQLNPSFDNGQAGETAIEPPQDAVSKTIDGFDPPATDGENEIPAKREHQAPSEAWEEDATSVMPQRSTSPALAFQETASLDPRVLSQHMQYQVRSGKRTLPEFIEPSKQDLLAAIDSDPEREWTDDELVLVEQVTGQLALALENARLFNQTQVALAETDEQAKRLSLLNQLGDQLTQAKGLEEIFAQSVMKTQEIFGSNHVSLSTLNNQADKLLVAAEIDNRGFISKGRNISLEDSPYRFAMIENRIFINPEIVDPSLGGVRSFMVGPLVVGGEVIGVMSVGSHQTNAFTRVDGDFLQQLTSLIGSMVDNRRLFDAVQSALSESEEQGRRLKLLNDMSELFAQATNMAEIAQVAAEKTAEVFRSNQAKMLLINAEEELAETLGAVGELNSELPAVEFEWDGSLGKVVRQKQVVVEEISLNEEENLYRSQMTAPIIVGGEVVSTISVGMDSNYLFTSTDQNMLSQITSLLAGTLENTRLFTQIQRRSHQLQAAANVSRMAGGILDSAELLQNVIDAIHSGFDLNYAGIFLVDKTGEWTGEAGKWAVLQAGTGEAGIQMLIAGHKLEIGGESMIGSAVADGQARIALDVGKEAVFFRNPYLPDTRSEMALPLISRGSVIGALTIQSLEETAFTQEDVTALQTMADQVANAIENVNLYEQSQKRATELSVLNEMASTFTQTLDLESIFEHMLQYTTRLMDARNFYIALYDKELDEIHLPVFKFRGSAHEDQGTRRRSGNGITEWIIRNRQPVLLRENAAAWISEHNLEIRGFDAQSWMGVPMMRGNEVIGVIALQSYSTARKYSQHDLDLLSAVASQAGIAIENARLFQQTQARAQREQERATQERLVRTITERMRSGQDIPTILQITLDELEKAFGINVSMIKLGDRDQLATEAEREIDAEAESIAFDGNYGE